MCIESLNDIKDCSIVDNKEQWNQKTDDLLKKILEILEKIYSEIKQQKLDSKELSDSIKADDEAVKSAFNLLKPKTKSLLVENLLKTNLLTRVTNELNNLNNTVKEEKKIVQKESNKTEIKKEILINDNHASCEVKIEEKIIQINNGPKSKNDLIRNNVEDRLKKVIQKSDHQPQVEEKTGQEFMINSDSNKPIECQNMAMKKAKQKVLTFKEVILS